MSRLARHKSLAQSSADEMTSSPDTDQNSSEPCSKKRSGSRKAKLNGRTVSTLTEEALKRKRENDRAAQAAIRARTKLRLETLADQVQALTSEKRADQLEIQRLKHEIQTLNHEDAKVRAENQTLNQEMIYLREQLEAADPIRAAAVWQEHCKRLSEAEAKLSSASIKSPTAMLPPNGEMIRVHSSQFSEPPESGQYRHQQQVQRAPTYIGVSSSRETHSPTEYATPSSHSFSSSAQYTSSHDVSAGSTGYPSHSPSPVDTASPEISASVGSDTRMAQQTYKEWLALAGHSKQQGVFPVSGPCPQPKSGQLGRPPHTPLQSQEPQQLQYTPYSNPSSYSSSAGPSPGHYAPAMPLYGPVHTSQTHLPPVTLPPPHSLSDLPSRTMPQGSQAHYGQYGYAYLGTPA